MRPREVPPRAQALGAVGGLRLAVGTGLEESHPLPLEGSGPDPGRVPRTGAQPRPLWTLSQHETHAWRAWRGSGARPGRVPRTGAQALPLGDLFLVRERWPLGWAVFLAGLRTVHPTTDSAPAPAKKPAPETADSRGACPGIAAGCRGSGPPRKVSEPRRCAPGSERGARGKRSQKTAPPLAPPDLPPDPLPALCRGYPLTDLVACPLCHL